MRALVFASPFLALALWGVASNAWSLADDDKGSNKPSVAGPVVTQSFAVGPFTAVSLDGSDNVRVIRGPAIAVNASGAQRVLEMLNIRVENNVLKIDRKQGRSSWSWRGDRGAMITVTMPAITAAAVGGSGDMTVDIADGAAFAASVEGSGNLTIASATVKRAALSAQGSGDLVISGTATDATMAAEGSGNIVARNLVSQQATIAVEGSGDVSANVRTRATIAVEGSGNVDVTGTENCTIVKEGSGAARCSR